MFPSVRYPRILSVKSYNRYPCACRPFLRAPTGVNKLFWRRCRVNGCCVNFEPSLTLYPLFSLFFLFYFFIMENTPIHQYVAPTSARLEPPKSVEPILTPGYELCPCLIKLIREQSFSRECYGNPYSHLREFE